MQYRNIGTASYNFENSHCHILLTILLDWQLLLYQKKKRKCVGQFNRPFANVLLSTTSQGTDFACAFTLGRPIAHTKASQSPGSSDLTNSLIYLLNSMHTLTIGAQLASCIVLCLFLTRPITSSLISYEDSGTLIATARNNATSRRCYSIEKF